MPFALEYDSARDSQLASINTRSGGGDSNTRSVDTSSIQSLKIFTNSYSSIAE